MRILYHHRIRSKDGQYVHLEELVTAIRSLGHEVLVVGPGNIEGERFGTESATVARLKRWLPRPIYELLEFAYNAPDFIRLMIKARETRPDVIYERYNLFLPSGIWVSRLLGIPLILEVNGPLYQERSRFGGIALDRLARWSERTVWRKADKVLPVTHVLARMVLEVGVASDRIIVVPNGINSRAFADLPSREDAKARLGVAGKVVLGFVGFMREWHGLERVLRFIAEERNRGLRAVFAGDGPDRSRLEAIAAELGVSDRVVMTGLVGRQEIPSVVAAFDVALQPDVVEYASPLKLFEYMAVGLPIVAPDSANIREVLVHEATGLLFDRSDEDAFIDAVARLVADPSLRQELGIAARRSLFQRGFTWDANARRVCAIAEELIQQRDRT